MSNIESINFEELKKKFQAVFHDESQLLRLLHEVIELTEIMQHQEQHKAFISLIVPELIKILRTKEPSFFDDNKNKIRRQTLEILHMMPFQDTIHPLSSELIEIYILVMTKDNEDNAEIALKTLIEMQKYYKTQQDILADKFNNFFAYCQELFKNMPLKLPLIYQPEESSKAAIQPENAPIRKSTESLKAIPHCCHYLLLINQMFEEKAKRLIEQLIPLLIDNICQFKHQELLPKVKNMPLYIEYLETLKNILSFFTFLLKKNYTDMVIDNIDYVLEVQLKILKNTPPQATVIRRDILHMIKYQFSEISNLEKLDKQGPNSRQHLFMRNKECNKKHIDDIFNMNVIFGQGKLSKELYYYTNTLIFSFISYMKDQMTLDQLKKGMQIIIKNMLDPMVALNLKNTLIFILYKLNDEIITKGFKSKDYQTEILESLVILYKDLRYQLKNITEEINQQKAEAQVQKTAIKWHYDLEQKNLPNKDLFQIEDMCLLENSMSMNAQSMIGQEPQPGDQIEQQKDTCSKIVKNLVSCVDTVIQISTDAKGTKFNSPHEMKLMKRLLIHGSHVIQSLYELIPNERERLAEILKKFANIFQKMKPLQFRDLFYAADEDFFGFVIFIRATKGDTGVVLLADYLMAQQPNPGNVADAHINTDNHSAYFLETFFDYISKKLRLFNKFVDTENKTICRTEMDKKLMAIPTPDLQDALQKLILVIGEKALARTNDARMKNLFFTVFVYCIKYTRASEIVPYYFVIIRNLFKDLCNLNDSNSFVKEFIPMIQGLLETFLQAKEEASFIRETNEICYTVPAKLKNLIEYLPVISKPLIDSMKSNSIELIESGINSIQLWVSALASYPEILDPVICNILPELNSMLYKILYLLPNYTFKLLGKLGAKSRLYMEDKEFKSKNYPEDGLKIELEDKYTNDKMVLGIDSAIDVVLLKIFDNYQKYSQQKLMEAYKLVKASFLCFIEPDIDMNYLVASIVNAKNKNNELLTQYAQNSTKFFDSKKAQIRISSLGRGSESHAFEKILKCLLIACSLPKNNPETGAVNKKVKKFFKWVTQYFTLIFICKNGKLKENLVNEISPIVFMENICDFLYYNMLQSVTKSQQRSYYKGSVIALKTMLKMLITLYGEDNYEVFNELEFLKILIQKICHLAYGQDLPKKVAANIALQIIIKYLPAQTIRLHYKPLIDSLFHILNTNYESLVFQVEKECRNTLDSFLQKVGMYSQELVTSIDEKDQAFVTAIWDKLIQNIHQNKKSARMVSMHFLELISKKLGNLKVSDIIQRTPCSIQQANEAQNPQNRGQIFWSQFFIDQEIERKAKHLFFMFKQGYSQILNLMSYLDLLQFLLKHGIICPFKKYPTYLAICEQLIKILEDETERYEAKYDNSTQFYQDQMVSNAAKSAVKYMKLEKSYIQQNKVYDPYSHTLYPHHFLSKQFFEVEEQAKREKFKVDLEKVKYSYQTHYEIFASPNNLDVPIPAALTVMSPEEIAEYKAKTNGLIKAFIGKMFSPPIKASDISYEYVHHFYELYPNLRLHTELISKCLTVLCDISTEDAMHQFFKERQQAFFDAAQPGQPQPVPQPVDGSPYLQSRVDFYAIEIKSKIISVYFKFFQREEANICKASKKCLNRILKKEQNQQEALPNEILKECVRPALNILSQRISYPALYKHLTKLIYVLHACFNDQLGKHLLKTYDNMKKSILDAYQFASQSLNANASAQQRQEGSENAAEQAPQDIPVNFNQDYERLIMQYNNKIEHLEIANNIVQILYLLPTAKDMLMQILTQIPEFEYQVCADLEQKFEENYRRLIQHYNFEPQFQYEQILRPLKIKLGLLKSEFRDGLSKFYNKNTYEALSLLNSQHIILKNVLLEILKEPNSYCLRERLSRETDWIKNCLARAQTLNDMVSNSDLELSLRFICIFIKYNPNYIVQMQNFSLVDQLRKRWMNLYHLQLDSLPKVSLLALRKIYSKIQSCLLAYCKHPKAHIHILFDLIKGYRYQSIIDQTPIKQFFCVQIPEKFSVEQKITLLSTTLEKMNSPKITYEQRYMIFELAFMPTIIKHADDPETFQKLMSPKMLQNFMQQFFGINLIQTDQGPMKKTTIQLIKENLENSQSVSYEAFQIEMTKVINLSIQSVGDFRAFVQCCPTQDCKPINHFLYQCAKRASSSSLKEWAFFTLTTMYIKILEKDDIVHGNEALLNMVSQGTEQIMMLILQHSSNLSSKALVHKAFENIIKIMNDPKIQMSPESKRDFVPMCLKRALNFEGRHNNSLVYLCSFILAHEKAFYDHSQQFSNKLHKVIHKFSQQYQPNLAQKQLTVELAGVLIKWSKRRMMEFPQDSIYQAIEEQKTFYMNINSNILYQLIRTSIMLHCNPNDPMKDILEISSHCLKEIRKIIIIHNNLKIQFPIINRLLQSDNDDKENIQLIRMILLNVSYILIKHQQESTEFKKFFMDFICSVNSRYYKCILFSTKIITDIVIFNNDPEIQAAINDKLKNLLQKDLQRCLDEDLDKIQQSVQDMEESCAQTGRLPILSFQDQAKLIYIAIPHFTIRLIHNINYIKKEQKNMDMREGGNFNLDDFQFYKNLASAIFRVVGFFRKNIVFDQNELASSRLRIRQPISYQATNALTKYTQDDLLTLHKDIVELKVEEPNYDLFNKESIMMGTKILVVKMKTMPQVEAMQICEIIQYILLALFKYNTNEYIIEWMRQIVEVLITDEEGDTSKLLLEQKCSFVAKMLSRITELSDIKKETPATLLLIDNIFEQCIGFLEKQNSLWPDYIHKLFEKVFVNSKGKNTQLKQRLFRIFEKFNNASIFSKLKFFFTRHQIDDAEKLVFFQCQSQLLDFTLYNFKVNLPLQKIQYSSRLFALTNLGIQFDQAIQFDDMNVDGAELTEKQRIGRTLELFSSKIKKYKGLILQDLMDPLSEIISINPSHSTDKLLSDKLFIKVFWQYWKLLTRDEQQFMAESINKFFLKTIPLISGQDQLKKQTLTKTFLESVSAISPQIRLEPEVLQLIGKKLNLWHVSIPILENHIVLYPQNERYVFALNELYQKLVEEDYIAGLRRAITTCPETRTMISYGQHHMWEEINQQFSFYIDYYAEQEGLYAQMDREQNIIGKYSCQISKDFIQKLQYNKKAYEIQQQQQLNPDMPISQPPNPSTYENPFDNPLYRDQVKPSNFPREGPNNKVREVDLRIWETLFIESVKVLNKWEQYRDIAHTMQNQEMWIEYYWHTKNWQELKQYESQLKKSDSIQYQLYYIYLIIQQQQIASFDEIFKQVIQLAYKEWDQYLPNYVDNIQFDNLIMFQLVMESSEGGRNMIKEAQNLKNRGRLADIKTAINIWRERVPHLCESISFWKEILENRNFIYEQISNIISPMPRVADPNLTQEQQQQFLEEQSKARKRFTTELLDKTWNHVKLASVSRKQGLPTLCNHYVQTVKRQFDALGTPDVLKYEAFKCHYEQLKLHFTYGQFNAQNIQSLSSEFRSIMEEPRYEPWQKAELGRLFGDYFLQLGNLKQAQSYFKQSLELNKKEAKTWFSYAKLNETVFNELKDEKSLANALKGYMCATQLALYKSRLIIPHVLKLIKRKEHSNSQTLSRNVVVANIDQMPTWIWIFWIPQLLTLLYSSTSNLEHWTGRYVLYKLCKLYPQATIYSVKAKQNFANQDPQKVIVELLKLLKNVNPQTIGLIQTIGMEFADNVKMSPEEELQILLTKILYFSQFLQHQNVEQEFRNFLDQVYNKFFRQEALQKSKLLRKLQVKFYQDFVNEPTREQNILVLMERLKNFKDFLQRKLSLSVMQTNLEEISTFLANFNDKGIELPGQYVINDSEPLPEHTIFIQKFEPMIYRSGINSKKIAIKGSNSKIYAFVMNSIQSTNDYSKFCSEERVVQLKIIMNQIFQRQKETWRRGIKFYTPIKVVMHLIRLNQDDLSFTNLQEVHDYLFSERGVDIDQAMMLQMNKAREIFDSFPEGQERKLQQINDEQIRRLNQETFDEMRTLHCQPYLLSSFIHRIFYNVDDLFIFKKEFTKYHAVNSFFSFIFNQIDYFTLNSISFCKTSGRLNFSESRFSDCAKKASAFQQLLNNQQPINLGQMEHQDFQTLNYLPFRLTNNIVELIGKTGLHGLFAGVMTSCSFALTKHQDKLLPVLQLIFRDEVSLDIKEEAINTFVEYLMYKIRSLSSNKRILHIMDKKKGEDGQNEEDRNEEAKQEGGDKFEHFGNMKVPKDAFKFTIDKPNILEEFNKKVFDLMDMAMEHKRLSQMPGQWNSWF